MRNPDSLTQKTNEDTSQGLAFAVGAYFLWGFLPLYMKLVSHMSAAEVVAHRIIWSLPIAAIVLIVLRRTSDLRDALKSPRTMGMACVTAALISINWGIYVWAISSGHALDAALGYYINPLFSIFLGAVLLGERLGGAGFDVFMGILCPGQEKPAHRAQSGVSVGGAGFDRASAGIFCIPHDHRPIAFRRGGGAGYLVVDW